MADERRVSFGIKTSQLRVTYREVLDVWREADGLDAFDDAWLWDHMVPLRGPVDDPTLEAWTLLAALAAQTRKLRLGVIVTSNRIRPPAVLAKMAATVDQISGGRLVFGIGAGGSAVPDPAAQALVRREFDAYGIDVVSPGDAIGALGEALEICRHMWTETEPFDFDGRYYHLTGAICEPKPIQRPGPPVMVAVAGPRGLGIAARDADFWVWPGDLDGFRRTSGALDEQCRAIGRDPATIVRSVQVFARPETIAQTRDQVVEFVDAGARHVVLGAIPPYPGSPAQWLADEIVNPVRERLG